jgi:hypothetical protein
MSFSEIFGTARALAEIWNVPLLACHDDTPYPKNLEDSRESKHSPAKPSEKMCELVVPCYPAVFERICTMCCVHGGPIPGRVHAIYAVRIRDFSGLWMNSLLDN